MKNKHLPYFMRDFHHQKDLFKAIEHVMGRDQEPYAVPWTNAQCYVIDRFLRFMARHGYVLRRTRAKGAYADIHETLRVIDDARLAVLEDELRTQEVGRG